jgi:uncharacterized membrane protein YhaH (DUF805 family)
MPHHYLLALLTPWGRVSQVPFFVLFLALVGADLMLFKSFDATVAENRAIDVQAGLLLLVAWMQFCLLSRRMHDAEKTGLFLLIFLALAVFGWCKELDPELLQIDISPTHRLAPVLAKIQHVGRLSGIVFFLIALGLPGTPGPNPFGAEFGEVENRVSRWRTESVMGAVIEENAARPRPKISARPNNAVVRSQKEISVFPLPRDAPPPRRPDFGRR